MTRWLLSLAMVVTALAPAWGQERQLPVLVDLVPDPATPAAAVAGAELLPPCIHGDDNFGLGCCTEPAPSYPNFPAITTLGRYACLDSCAVETVIDVRIDLEQPVFVLCDTAEFAVRVTPLLGGFPSMSGKLRAKYSRTWQLTGNGIKQIWRFLLNGDLALGNEVLVTSPCPAPPGGPRHHFFGHIDYICDPSQAHVDLLLDSFSLNKLPGCISHAPGTARPKTGPAAHYGNSYHLVAPANFSFTSGGPGNLIGGPVFGDAVRSSFVGGCFPSTYSCVGEARVQGGEYFSANCDICACAAFPCVGPYRHYGMSVPVDCNGEVTILEGARGVIPVAPEGIIGLDLGGWSGGLAPQGSTELFVKYGAVSLARPCLGEARGDHTVFGVGTYAVEGSEPVLFSDGPSDGGLPISTFIDLQNSLVPQSSLSTGGVFCTTLADQFGAPAYGDVVIQLNN